jgi:transcriptional regulator
VLLSPFTEMTDRDEIATLVRDVAVAQLVTTGDDGVPLATLLPILWDGDGRVIAHASASNGQFHDLAENTPALAIVTGPDAYVSPTWYPSKAKRGLAVPTWNYLAVHLTGTLTVHRDPAWMIDAVRRLSDHHETGRNPTWALDQAPEKYVAGLLKGIVGLELTVTRVEAKAKLSQNRTLPDRLGVIDGLNDDGSARAVAVAREMSRRTVTLGP